MPTWGEIQTYARSKYTLQTDHEEHFSLVFGFDNDRTQLINVRHFNAFEKDWIEFRSCIWRMNVDADAQGKGVGRFAVEATADEARKRGFDRLTVLWEPGDDSPEEFFLRVGFVVVGDTPYGEKIGALAL